MMTDYSSKDAIDELLTLGVNLLFKAERDVKKKRVTEVATMYVLVRREGRRVEEEATRLKLEGELDSEVYEKLADGYDSLGKVIMEIAKSEWLAADVYVLSRGLKNSVEKRWSSLAEYARSELGK
jgi:hypothetical protein